MMADEPNTPSTGDQQRAPDNQPVMAEYAPFGGDQSLPAQDTSLIMSTLFNDQGGDQGGVKPDGKSPDAAGAVAAPSPPAAPVPAPADGKQAAQPGSGQEPEIPAFPGAAGSQPQADAKQTPSPAPAPAAAPAPAPAPTQADAEAKLRMESLENMVLSLQQQLKQQTTAPAPGNQPNGQGPQSSADPAEAAITLTVPPTVQQALFSDDPATQQAALAHIVSSTATIAYQNAMRAVKPLIEAQINSYAGSQQQVNEGERITREYYEGFPAHNNPLYHDLIGAEFQKMFAEMPGLAWGPEARNALGARVNNKLTALGINVSTVQPPAPPGQQQQQEQPPVVEAKPNGSGKPAAMMDSGSRGAQSGSRNFIADTLG